MENLCFCGLLSIIHLEVTVASILFFCSRLSQVRHSHLGTLSVVKSLEASDLALQRETT